ncbi:MAG: TolC family protein [Myxococcota bacterium]
MLWLTLARAASPAPPTETLTLEDAVARLAADSPVSAALAAQQAEARSAVTASTARLLPTVALQGRYVRNNAEAVAPIGSLFSLLPAIPPGVEVPGDLVIQPLDQWLGTATVDVPLVVPAAWADRGASQRGVRAAGAAGEAGGLQAEVALRSAAWMARAAEETLEATRVGMESARAHRDSAARRRDAGLDTDLDVLQAEAELLRREQLHEQAVADLDAARRGLGAMLGVAGPVEIETGELPAAGEGTADLASHPERRALEERREAASKARLAARLQHLPSVAGFATATASSAPFPTGQKTAWSVGAQARWVLFDGGARYAMSDRASAQIAAADAELWKTDTALSRRLQDALEAERVAVVQLQLAEKGVEVARAAEATSQRLFESGVGESLATLDAQQRRMEAEVGLAGARARLAVSRIALEGLGAR